MSSTKARKLLKQTGAVSAQTTNEWTGPFSLPESIISFYAEGCPADLRLSGLGDEFYLPSLSKLWELQGGYRYDPSTEQNLPGWDGDWLVVASEGSDPFILCRETGVVSTAMHGEGSWDPDELFSDFSSLVGVLSALGLVAEAAKDELSGEDECVKPVHAEEARALLTSMVGSRQGTDTVLEWFGWIESEID